MEIKAGIVLSILVCLIFTKNQARYAYKCYAYKKKHLRIKNFVIYIYMSFCIQILFLGSIVQCRDKQVIKSGIYKMMKRCLVVKTIFLVW